jgi:hypothetical protein
MTISFSSAGAEPLTVAHRAADPESWPVAVRFDPIDRWYARIAATVEQEVWLLTWLPGQETDLHDHGGSGGGFVVASGALTEETVVGGQLRTAVLDVGNGRQFGARYVHRVGKPGRPARGQRARIPAGATPDDPLPPGRRAVAGGRCGRGRCRVVSRCGATANVLVTDERAAR